MFSIVSLFIMLMSGVIYIIKTTNIIRKIALFATVLYTIIILILLGYEYSIGHGKIGITLVRKEFIGEFYVILVFLILPIILYLIARWRLSKIIEPNFFANIIISSLTFSYTYMISVLLFAMFIYKEGELSVSTALGKLFIFLVLLIVLVQFIDYYCFLKFILLPICNEKYVDSFFKYATKFSTMIALLVTINKRIFFPDDIEADLTIIPNLKEYLQIIELTAWGFSISLLFYEIFLFKLSSVWFFIKFFTPKSK